MKNRWKNLFPTSFRGQLIGGIGLFLTLLITLFVYFEISSNVKTTFKKGLEQASDHSKVLASMVKTWVLSDDYAGLEEALENFSIYNDLVFATIIDMDGKVLAHTDKSLVGQYISDERRIAFLRKIRETRDYDVSLFRHGNYIDVFRVIHNQNEHIGIVHLRFDRSARLALIKKQIYEGIGFGFLYLSAIFTMLYVIVNTFTRQLQSLLETMIDVHNGNREVRADEEGYNELSQVSREFNRMLDAIVAGEKELKIVKERLESAITGTQDGLWDWNLTTDEVYFSPRWKEMLGYRDDELPNIVETWTNNVHPDDLQQAEEAVAYSHQKPGQFYESIHRIRHKDGHWLWILDRGQTLFDENGKPVRMVGFHTDISKQKALEQELIEQEELMISQSRHVAMGEMIGMIAHQWRQPITVIAMGANNLILDVELDEVSVEHVAKEAHEILKQTDYLSQTIDDFRNFFRPNKDKEAVKIVDILTEAREIVGKSLEYHSISLRIESDENSTVLTYGRELLQVFLNIIKNAEEAIEQHRTQGGHIDARVEDQGDSLRITIADNGGGADENVVTHIFDPYFSTKDKKTGTGLGLYMSKTIVDKHLHGTITAGNQDEGLCFSIVIPKQIEEKDA